MVLLQKSAKLSFDARQYLALNIHLLNNNKYLTFVSEKHQLIIVEWKIISI